MDIKRFLLENISAKLKKERAMELSFDEYKGKRPDALLKSSGQVMGIILMFMNESHEDMLNRIQEFDGLGAQLYVLVQKGSHKAVTDMLWKKSLYGPKVVTWDIGISF